VSGGGGMVQGVGVATLVGLVPSHIRWPCRTRHVGWSPPPQPPPPPQLLRYHIDFAETPCFVSGGGDGANDDSVIMELTERTPSGPLAIPDGISAPRYEAHVFHKCRFNL
jgi:hypothetical protein